MVEETTITCTGSLCSEVPKNCAAVQGVSMQDVLFSTDNYYTLSVLYSVILNTVMVNSMNTQKTGHFYL